MKTLEFVLNGLMRRYRERVPDVNKVADAMIAEGIITDANEIENDHVAFRTMGVPQLGVQSFEKIFLHFGYQKRDFFNFEGKKSLLYLIGTELDFSDGLNGKGFQFKNPNATRTCGCGESFSV